MTRPPFDGHGYGTITIIEGGDEMSSYTSEFKLVVAKRAMKAQTYMEVAREFDIHPDQVKNWFNAYRKYGDLAFEPGGPLKFSEDRIEKQSEEISELKEEIEILKKATAIFSKNHQK